MKYSHLSLEQRYKLQAGLELSRTQKSLVSELGVSAATICREIRRNGGRLHYKAEAAQQRYRHVRTTRAAYKLTEELRARILVYLYDFLSPEQIVGLCRRNNIDMVSHEAIYQFIWRCKKGGHEVYKCLRHGKAKRQKRGHSKHKRGQISGRRDISERSAEVEDRKRFGDLEIDTIIGKNHKGCILSVVDRYSGYAWLRLLPSKEAEHVSAALNDIFLPAGPSLHTITSDNGKEFANHQQIAKDLELDFYFARPYKSCDRGSNENLNGLVRQFIPKGSDLSTISEERIQQIQDILNARPRKRFGFLSPRQFLEQNQVDLKFIALRA